MEPTVHELVHRTRARGCRRPRACGCGRGGRAGRRRAARRSTRARCRTAPRGDDPEGERRRPPQRPHDREGEGHGADPRIEREGPPQRPLDGEHHRRSRRQPRQAPGERREDALLTPAHAPRARRARAGRPSLRPAGGRGRRLSPGSTWARASAASATSSQGQRAGELPGAQRGSSTSWDAEPEASHDATSRYMRPRSPRTRARGTAAPTA